MANENNISDVIVRCAAKGKFLEFSNALTLAYKEDYANIQGIGGSGHARTSGITAAITAWQVDQLGRKIPNTQSTFVKAIVPCYVFDQVLTVCRNNVGDRETGVGFVMSAIDSIANALGTFFGEGVNACARIVTGKGANQSGPIGDFGTAFKNARAAAAQRGPAQFIRPFENYAYHQDRVNKYNVDPKDGFVSVSTLEIVRAEFGGGGEKRKLPWTVKVQNFWAAPNEKANGTTAYVANSIRDKKEASISISDDAMYEAAFKVMRFVDLWENTLGSQLLITAMREKEAARQQNAAQNGQATAQPQQQTQQPAPAQQGGYQRQGQNPGYGNSYGQQPQQPQYNRNGYGYNANAR